MRCGNRVSALVVEWPQAETVSQYSGRTVVEPDLTEFDDAKSKALEQFLSGAEPNIVGTCGGFDIGMAVNTSLSKCSVTDATDVGRTGEH